MELSAVPAARWSQLNGLIAGAMGLHFPDERRSDLRRGMAAAAAEFGFADVAACIDWLLSGPPTRAQMQVLASHLTIGETYFFRDGKTFAALSGSILPELIRSRRGGDRRLRLWSAGCCTGEEPYSLAVMLLEELPDLADWEVTILGTDINPHFLRKAASGSYGAWSFRGAPAGFKERYFEEKANGRFLIRSEIRKRVTFAYSNLIENLLPSPAADANAIDVIFCRNVLMYFTPAQARKVIGNLHHLLTEGGCLIVSPSEASQALFPQFVTRNFPGVIVYQKSGAKTRAGSAAPAWQPAPPSSASPSEPAFAEVRSSSRPAKGLSVRALSAEAPPANARLVPLQIPEPGPVPGAPEFSPLARACANAGRLLEALGWCDRWIAADKLNPGAHYLRAIVVLEQGEQEDAANSLQRALYLAPDFVLAHFALGNLARSRGKAGAGEKHFENALKLLGRLPPEAVLPESDGLTAARLMETIATLSLLEKVP